MQVFEAIFCRYVLLLLALGNVASFPGPKRRKQKGLVSAVHGMHLVAMAPPHIIDILLYTCDTVLMLSVTLSVDLS